MGRDESDAIRGENRSEASGCRGRREWIEGLKNTPNVRDILSKGDTMSLVLKPLNKRGANQSGSLSASNQPFLTRILLCLMYYDPGCTQDAPKHKTRLQYRVQAFAGCSADEITGVGKE